MTLASRGNWAKMGRFLHFHVLRLHFLPSGLGVVSVVKDLGIEGLINKGALSQFCDSSLENGRSQSKGIISRLALRLAELARAKRRLSGLGVRVTLSRSANLRSEVPVGVGSCRYVNC